MKLREQISESFLKHGPHPALSLALGELTYEQLWQAASQVADELIQGLPPGPIGLLGGREPAMYVGVLAAVLSGRAYVPLNVKFPPGRLAEMLTVAGCAGILHNPAHADLLEKILQEAGPAASEKSQEQTILPGAAIAMARFTEDRSQQAAGRENEAFAYILFTSGSTGRPKGIGISADNLCAYLAHATTAYGVQPGDRASQMFELTFDLSVHDLFVTWLGGGCLCVPAGMDLMAPARFILHQRLTHWFSVPSTISLLSKLRLLRENTFPGLRQSLFCGEALPTALAQLWQAAAPGSSVWNLYGPTEATIAITAHQIGSAPPLPGSPASAVVPIGRAFPGHQTAVVADGQPVAAGETGELCLCGPQVSQGYLANPERTAEAFVHLAAWPDGRTWYRTGDLVKEDASGQLHYIGRLDSQIQVHGHRVELGEVEAALRHATSGRAVAAIGWPRQGATVEGIIGFAEGPGTEEDAKTLLASLGRSLPAYMLPSRILFVPTMPLNSNGKTDRNALALLLQ